MSSSANPRPPRRPRVVFVSTYYPPVIGGAEAAASRLATYLHRRGHETFVLTKRTAVDSPERETIDGVPVERLPPVGRRSAFGKWLFVPVVFRALLARRDRFDAIAVVDQRGVGLAALAAARLLKRPVVFEPQTEGTLGSRHPLRSGVRGAALGVISWPARWLYGRADGIACITTSIMDGARELGVPESRLHYIPNPVDIRQFTPLSADERHRIRAGLGLSDDDVVFSFTGRLSREKGVRELLTAWREVAKPGRVLLVIGPAMPGHPWDESAWAKQFVAEARLGSSVRLLGPKPHDELSRIVAAADVAVLPSHFEAHPLAAVEAMACGRPIVATRVGGVPDFVIPEVNGLLVPPKNTGALAAALERMAGNSGLRARLGPAAREAAEAFDEDVVLERFAVLLEDLTRGDSRPSSV